jgi:hypothetical protein
MGKNGKATYEKYSGAISNVVDNGLTETVKK